MAGGEPIDRSLSDDPSTKRRRGAGGVHDAGTGCEGVPYVGVAQEKARVLRIERRYHLVYGPPLSTVASKGLVVAD